MTDAPSARTPPAPSASPAVAAIADRQRRLARLRERYAVELFDIWRTTTEGRRYETATGADRRLRAQKGWQYVAMQLRLMADVVEDLNDTATEATDGRNDD